MPVKPIPEGLHSLTPHLVVTDAARAIEFYTKAFGAKLIHKMDMGGKIGHAEMQIGDSKLFLNDEFPQMHCLSPASAGATASMFIIHLQVEDVDKSFEQAVAAGATVTMPLADMFWGDRYGKLTDPFGHHWSLATHKEDLTPAEMESRGAAAMAGMAKG